MSCVLQLFFVSWRFRFWHFLVYNWLLLSNKAHTQFSTCLSSFTAVMLMSQLGTTQSFNSYVQLIMSKCWIILSNKKTSSKILKNRRTEISPLTHFNSTEIFQYYSLLTAASNQKSLIAEKCTQYLPRNPNTL